MLLAAEQAVKSNPSGLLTIVFCFGGIVAFVVGVESEKLGWGLLGAAMWALVLLHIWWKVF